MSSMCHQMVRGEESSASCDVPAKDASPGSYLEETLDKPKLGHVLKKDGPIIFKTVNAWNTRINRESVPDEGKARKTEILEWTLLLKKTWFEPDLVKG